MIFKHNFLHGDLHPGNVRSAPTRWRRVGPASVRCFRVCEPHFRLWLAGDVQVFVIARPKSGGAPLGVTESAARDDVEVQVGLQRIMQCTTCSA
jgi:hypothetical protein